ncbi:site-specific DNA-methyltransferase [Phascolarctobacterium succinatutens]|uniref:site-specific DNA-methyltransferase n=1 Tax=Phascolarctobacterium succinatutens TaxID=626940 RepID=UPI0026E96AB0|nr:site-specific DNA-methyltransferase [Phascolarctobacterium succinatutens]
MMEHLNMQSMDKVAANVAKIRELFPNCVTERINKEGKLEHAIDFDMLKQELSDHVVDGLQERYQFTWPDKRKAILAANAPINKTLRPCREESVDFDNTENLYIEGDNLEVLKLLQETYLGKVKMIYIDPPYNTGNDFVYEDDFKQSADEYIDNSGQLDDEGNRLVANTERNGRFHTDWLNMIYPRLKLAKDLLSEDGVIFISIDEHESENLKKVSHEIFGEQNYFGDLVWEATTQPINAGSAKFGLQKKTEIILLYGKNKSKISGFDLEQEASDLSYPHTGKFGSCRFEVIEKSDAGDYNRDSMKFKILGQSPRPGKRWQIGKDLAIKLAEEGKLEIVDGLVKRAVYPEDEIDKIKVKPFWSLMLAENVGSAKNGKEELNSVMGTPIGFDTVKPLGLIKKLLSYIGKNYLILDFFSGSATTAHAVMQLNAEDGGKRKFIMVQLPEVCAENSEAYKAGYKNICEIGKERIRRAGKKIKEENLLTTLDLDIGFRVLKCDSSNMEDVYFTPKEYMDKQQNLFVDNIKADRSDEDLLFDAMLKLDTPLSSKIEKRSIAGKTVYNVAQGHLMACFDKNVTDEVITAIAKEMPSYFVMRDSSQADDSVAINFEQIFNTYSPQTVRRVL